MQTNLAVEEEDGVGVLAFDDIPQPFHGGTVGDIRRVGRPSAASELGDEFIVGADNSSAGVAASSEWTRIAVVRVHRDRDRVEVAQKIITAPVGLKPIETTDGGTRCAAMLDDESCGDALDVLAVRLPDLCSSENDLELIEAVFRIVELGGHIQSRAKKTHELARIDFRA